MDERNWNRNPTPQKISKNETFHWSENMSANETPYLKIGTSQLGSVALQYSESVTQQ